MSRFDRSAQRALKSSYYYNADVITLSWQNGESQRSRGIIQEGVELLDPEAEIVIRTSTLSCIKTELEHSLKRGTEVTDDSDASRVWEVGRVIKENRHEITVEIE